MSDSSPTLRPLALHALRLTDVRDKLAAVAAIAPDTPVDVTSVLTCPDGVPGRPTRPHLVPPTDVPRRKLATRQGRAALLHALAHIEFNAINLSLDAVWRFAGMPAAYYTDWMQVAREEAYHFDLLNRHLSTLGMAYGDCTAHDGLWQMVQRTEDDVLARMALVPRTLEARGLDVSPAIRNKLAQAGDEVAAGILDIILRDEIGHVRIGNYWFKWLCARAGRDPVPAYREVAKQYQAPRLRGPFNLPARRQAGFEEDEIAALLAE